MLLDLFRRGRPQDISTSHELQEEIIRGHQMTRSGMPVNSDTAMRASAVYSSVRVLAEGVAMLPLLVYRRLGEGGKERATRHPLFKLLHSRPNSWQTSFEFREMLMGHLALRGNFYGWKNTVGTAGSRRIREIVPLHPDRVTPEQDDDLRIRYTYITPRGEERTFDQGEIFHIRGLSTDGVRGLNPIAHQRESIGLYMAVERHGSNFFGNGAQPSGALKHPKTLSDNAKRHLEESLSERHGGEASGTPIVLEEGMDWQQISVSNEDSQFLETYKLKRSEIAAIFRVPPHLIGDLSDATFSNIEQQSLDLVRYTLMPWLVRIEQAIQRDLVAERADPDIFAEHLVEGLLRGDTQARKDFYSRMINWGVMSPNEVRERENMNPREGGDTFYVPANVLRQGQEDMSNGNADSGTS